MARPTKKQTDLQETKEQGRALPSLTIDWEMYAQYLEDSDLSDQEKKEFIETLWNLVVAFVDLGCGVHPLQQVCEQKDNLKDLLSTCADDVLNSEAQNPKNETVKASKSSAAPVTESLEQ